MNRMLASLALIGAALPLTLAGTAQAAPPAKAQGPAKAPEDVRIPFAAQGGIRDWRAVNDNMLYIQATNGDWFRAELIGSCPGIRMRETIAFESDPNGSFTRFSSIRSRGMECPVKTLVRSGPPPKKAKPRS